MRKHISLISVALLLLGWSATAGIPRTAAQQAVAKIRSQEPLRYALVGVLAVRADGDTLAAINIREKLVPASNVLCALAFAGGTQFNFVAGWACAILSTVVAAAVTYLFGFDADSEAFVEDAE